MTKDGSTSFYPLVMIPDALVAVPVPDVAMTCLGLAKRFLDVVTT